MEIKKRSGAAVTSRTARVRKNMDMDPAKLHAARAVLGTRSDTETVDLARLVEATQMFTPADIEFAARKGAQTAFEREVLTRQGEPAATEDYLAAIAETRPTLTAQALTAFNEDIENYARL